MGGDPVFLDLLSKMVQLDRSDLHVARRVAEYGLVEWIPLLPKYGVEIVPGELLEIAVRLDHLGLITHMFKIFETISVEVIERSLSLSINTSRNKAFLALLYQLREPKFANIRPNASKVLISNRTLTFHVSEYARTRPIEVDLLSAAKECSPDVLLALLSVAHVDNLVSVVRTAIDASRLDNAIAICRAYQVRGLNEREQRLTSLEYCTSKLIELEQILNGSPHYRRLTNLFKEFPPGSMKLPQNPLPFLFQAIRSNAFWAFGAVPLETAMLQSFHNLLLFDYLLLYGHGIAFTEFLDATINAFTGQLHQDQAHVAQSILNLITKDTLRLVSLRGLEDIFLKGLPSKLLPLYPSPRSSSNDTIMILAGKLPGRSAAACNELCSHFGNRSTETREYFPDETSS
jgi:hypothetical protein